MARGGRNRGQPQGGQLPAAEPSTTDEPMSEQATQAEDIDALQRVDTDTDAGTAPLDDAAMPPPVTARPPGVPQDCVPRLVTGNVTAWGYCPDGHLRDGWAIGERAWFQQHVVDSAPGCFTTID